MRMTRVFGVIGLVLMLMTVCTSCRKKPAEPQAPTEPQAEKPTAEGPEVQTEESSQEQTRKPPEDPKRLVHQHDAPSRPKPVQIADDEWTMNFEAAKAKAVAQKKHLLINFSGSDWCGWCIRLEAEVFGKEDFRRAAGKQFVLVNLDYPQDALKVSQEVRQQNARLQEYYKIEGFPTVLLTFADGRPYAATGYREGGVEPYLAHLKELRDIGSKVQELLAQSATASDPLTKAKLIDQALELLGPEVADRFYEEQIDQVVQLDANNAAGLKDKYLLRKRFNDVEKALSRQDFAEAVKIVDDILNTFKPTGSQAQQLYFARAHALHYLQRTEEEKAALEKALAAAPDSEGAEGIRRLIEQLFPPPPKLVLDGNVTTTMQPYQSFIPERTFDGDAESYFWSVEPVQVGAALTITLDEAKAFQKVRAVTGADQFTQFGLGAGVLELSTDGTTFEKLADFENGRAEAAVQGKIVKAVRIRCTKAQPQGLIIREVTLE